MTGEIITLTIRQRCEDCGEDIAAGERAIVRGENHLSGRWAHESRDACTAAEDAAWATFEAAEDAPEQTPCPHYTEDQGCPLHGETCAPRR